MGRKAKVTDEQLESLSSAVEKLVRVFTGELNELRGRLDMLEAYAPTGPILDDTFQVTLYQDDGGAVAEAEAEPDYDGRGTASEEAAKDDTEPYELVFSKTLYVSGDDAFDVAGKLLLAARDVRTDATFLTLATEYIPAGDDGEPAYFAGNVTVGV